MLRARLRTLWGENVVWIRPVALGVPLGLLITALLGLFVYLTLHQGWNDWTAGVLIGSGITVCSACVAGIAAIPKMKAEEQERKRKADADAEEERVRELHRVRRA